MIWEGLTPPYRCITADPPWRFRSPGTQMRAAPRYSTMDLSAICALPVADIAAPDAHLWLWAINGLMEEAHQVVRAWGFRPTTIVTWCKPGAGTGHYLRNNTEHAIFATRGKPMTQDPSKRPLSTWYEWPRSPHSVKPVSFYQLVEQVSPEPRVELFTRQGRFGWDGWGLGVESLRA